MAIVEKPWGTTETQFKSDAYHAELLHINPHSGCSLHVHDTKWNAFLVIEGMLVIEWYDVGGMYHYAYLRPGDFHSVAPGLKHRFTNRTDERVVAHECYHPDAARPDDIFRYTKSGPEEMYL